MGGRVCGDGERKMVERGENGETSYPVCGGRGRERERERKGKGRERAGFNRREKSESGKLFIKF